MIKCYKCNKEFQTKKRLINHTNKTPNCTYKCSICLKLFSSKQSLSKHVIITCKPNYECHNCKKRCNTQHNLNIHLEKCTLSKVVNEKKKNILPKKLNISEIVRNIPTDKQVNVNIKIINNNNIVNKVNSDNKIINRNKNVFFDQKPVNFNFGYVKNEDIDYKELSLIDGYNEQIVDMYMYEENKFKEEQPKDMIYKYEKENLKVRGMRLLFTQLQKNPKNRNTRIKKIKSGKCHIYDKEWIEEKIQKIITKICCNLCDLLYDKETSLNYFIRLVIADQPRRLSELRKHIKEEIIRINEIEKDELLKIE
jgi:hypothetical protein